MKTTSTAPDAIRQMLSSAETASLDRRRMAEVEDKQYLSDRTTLERYFTLLSRVEEARRAVPWLRERLENFSADPSAEVARQLQIDSNRLPELAAQLSAVDAIRNRLESIMGHYKALTLQAALVEVEAFEKQHEDLLRKYHPR